MFIWVGIIVMIVALTVDFLIVGGLLASVFGGVWLCDMMGGSTTTWSYH